ncbi:MAG: hypothetical protein OHK0057_36120 [Thermoflexibacter sp.]
MNEEIAKIIHRADDCLFDAQLNHQFQRYIACINRSYYCIFDCLQALLYVKGIFAKTHQGTHIKFHELYLKTRILPEDLGAKLDFVFDLRQAGDYDYDATLTQEDAEKALEIAKSFLETTKKILS